MGMDATIDGERVSLIDRERVSLIDGERVSLIDGEIRRLIDAALRGELSQEGAQRAVELGAEAVVAIMLAVSRRIAELTGAAPHPQNGGPHTPSGAIPPYAKASASKRRRRRLGAREGHAGHHRPTSPTPDRRERLDDLKVCPECHGPVKKARRWRTRIIEDMPEDTAIEAVEYKIPRHWCPCCKKHVEPKVGAALPGATIGHRLAAMTVIFHYGLGLTIDQTRQILLSPLRMTFSAGGLVNLWQRTAEVLAPWYEQIAQEAKNSAVLHADETGWRVEGRTHWLWCFCNHTCSYYMIDRSRGSPALKRFFTEAFRGVLIHDFWRPYESVLLEGDGDHQCCLAHLLRELDHVDEQILPRKSPPHAACWRGFVKMLRRLLRDGIRLRRRKDFDPARYRSRIHRIDVRLVRLASECYIDADAARLAKRLHRHQNELFTFLDRPDASWENNRAEREIRPAVILRKNSQCNRSERGAATQAVLMSIHRTLKRRGLDPRQTIADALTAYAATGTLPPLPSAVADG
jgi:transposase